MIPVYVCVCKEREAYIIIRQQHSLRFTQPHTERERESVLIKYKQCCEHNRLTPALGDIRRTYTVTKYTHSDKDMYKMKTST